MLGFCGATDDSDLTEFERGSDRFCGRFWGSAFRGPCGILKARNGRFEFARE